MMKQLAMAGLIVAVALPADGQSLSPDERPRIGIRSQSKALGLGTTTQCTNGASGGNICPGNINNNQNNATERDGSTYLGQDVMALADGEGWNTALGYGALYSMQGIEGKYSFNNYVTVYNGMMNVAVGLRAMYSSTALGCNSGTAGGSLNTVVGALAGYNVGCTSGTGGYSNVFIGEADGMRVTTGFFNVIIGNDVDSQSGGSTSMHDAVVVGAEAAVKGTGNFDVVLGSHAGSSGLSGIENIIIGPYVGSTTLTTGVSNILIGVDSSTDTAAGGTSNTVQIKGTGTAVLSATGTDATPAITLGGGTTISGDLTLLAHNLITDTTTGLKLGTGTTQKLGFFNVTPVAQQTGDLVTGLSNLGLITSGTVATATNATNVATTSTSTNATFYPLFVASSSNSNQAASLSTGLTFNASTGVLTVNTAVSSGKIVVTGSTVPADVGIYAPAAHTLGLATNGALAAQIDTNGVPLFAGSKRTTGTFTKTSNTTLAAITGLSTTLAAGKTYDFQIWLYTTSGASGGIQVDLNGGTATATALVAVGEVGGAGGGVYTQTTTLAGTQCAVTAVTTNCYIHGTITVNAGGTFSPEFAQNASNGTSSTVVIGSSMFINQIN